MAEDKNKEVKCWVYAQRGVVWIKKTNGVRERDREESNQEGVSHMRGLDL